MTHTPTPVASPEADATTADLIKQASAQVSSLIRDEVALARGEMMTKARNAGIGAGMIGGAGILAAYGVGALLVCAGLALALVLPGWLAALIVAVALYVIAGVLVLIGRARLKRATPPTPADAIAGLRADVNEVSGALHRGPPSNDRITFDDVNDARELDGARRSGGQYLGPDRADGGGRR